MDATRHDIWLLMTIPPHNLIKVLKIIKEAFKLSLVFTPTGGEAFAFPSAK